MHYIAMTFGASIGHVHALYTALCACDSYIVRDNNVCMYGMDRCVVGAWDKFGCLIVCAFVLVHVVHQCMHTCVLYMCKCPYV